MPEEKWYWPRVEIKRLEPPKEQSDDETSGSDSEEEQEKLEAEVSIRSTLRIHLILLLFTTIIYIFANILMLI